ncbi:MAG: DUF5677 domain-containing protein [Planctomycetes bacterium]|nr:DUF5677 domain-containing protein [Planctomycetota bacterium]
MVFLRFGLQDPSDEPKYREILQGYHDCCRTCVDFLLRILELLNDPEKKRKPQLYSGVVFLLTRHVAEHFDAIAVLASEGCCEACKVHLRSAFEASLQIRYLLEADSEQRGVAYHVATVHQRNRIDRQLMPGSDFGKELRATATKGSMEAEIFATLDPVDYAARIARREALLTESPYAEVNTEWQRLHKDPKRPPPHWYQLFGGPSSVRKLARRFDMLFWYDLIYSSWSGNVHAGDALDKVAPDPDNPAGSALYPLRHPANLWAVCGLVAFFTEQLEQLLSQHFLEKHDRDALNRHWQREIPERFKKSQRKINVPWS